MLICKLKLSVMILSIMKMFTSSVIIPLLYVPLPIEITSNWFKIIPHAYFPAFKGSENRFYLQEKEMFSMCQK